MRVLFWLEYDPSVNNGGVEVWTRQFAPALRDRGYQVELVCNSPAESAVRTVSLDGIPLHRFPFQSVLLRKELPRLAALQAELRALFTRFQPHLVHMNTLQASAFCFLRIPERKIARLLLTLHEPVSWSYYRNGFVKNLAAEASWITTVSCSLHRDFCSLNPSGENRSSALLNALPDTLNTPAPFPEGDLRLLSAGRLVKEKGFDLVPEALARLNDLPFRWIVAGGGVEKKSLQEQCDALGLSSKVEFIGPVSFSEVYEQMDAAHAVIMPSRIPEAFGLVALQALQRGRPVIASRIGGLPEIISHEQTGWLVEPDQPAALAEAIRHLASAGPRLREIGNNARLRATSHFSFHRMMDEYTRLYTRIVSAPFASLSAPEQPAPVPL
jgi:glycosyltransferase involved in cell wall biosynthesis